MASVEGPVRAMGSCDRRQQQPSVHYQSQKWAESCCRRLSTIRRHFYQSHLSESVLDREPVSVRNRDRLRKWIGAQAELAMRCMQRAYVWRRATAPRCVGVHDSRWCCAMTVPARQCTSERTLSVRVTAVLFVSVLRVVFVLPCGAEW
jgi:hypothetical protein